MGAAQSAAVSSARARLLRGVRDFGPPTLELFLASRGLISSEDMMRVLALRSRQEASSTDILIGLGMIGSEDLARAQAERLDERYVDLEYDPPSPSHLERFGAARALNTGVLPWRQRNGFTVIVTHRPELFERHRAELEACFGPVRRAFADPNQITKAITDLQSETLVHRAEHRVTEQGSCRSLNFRKLRLGLWIAAIVFTIGCIFTPSLLFGTLAAWAIITLVFNTALKVISGVFFLTREKIDTGPASNAPVLARMPQISILLPLFREKEVATQLVARMRRLNYPKELLDVILVVEQDDQTTQDTLARTRLPHWIRTLAVPKGAIKTKPRAMNYALDHCRGSIIGVYDAEDAPDPFQLKRVVRRFAERGQEVACLQGTLDFYNARANWLARCFTVEYATWFRIVLPGLERLGLPVPLGGTTLFFRREALERLGGWDAHNVTEDADLGIRLARFGYRTELLPTATYEEANCRAWPWVRQRSRWLKGFAITWAVHMRRPKKLLSDLGPWKFFGVQLLFAGTLSQFLLAPVLWTFWLLLLGLPHPLQPVLPHGMFIALGILFFISELLSIAVGMLAVSGANHRHLIKWVPSLHFYFPLGTIAGFKGVAELFYKPFYWDKTDHGVSGADMPTPNTTVIRPRRASGASQTPDLSAVSRLHTRLLRRGQKLQ